jgi:hypothetical protein
LILPLNTKKVAKSYTAGKMSKIESFATIPKDIKATSEANNLPGHHRRSVYASHYDPFNASNDAFLQLLVNA